MVLCKMVENVTFLSNFMSYLRMSISKPVRYSIYISNANERKYDKKIVKGRGGKERGEEREREKLLFCIFSLINYIACLDLSIRMQTELIKLNKKIMYPFI